MIPPPDLPSEADVLARASTENFPVALRILPSVVRHQLLSLYGFARLVDQIGDAYGGDRLAALDWVAAELATALDTIDRRAGSADLAACAAGLDVHPLVGGAAATLRSVRADPGLLYDLIEANRRDQTVTRYPTFDDLIEYCRYSANPVGRLVLAVFSVATPERERLSDAICTGLQLAEHLQDVAEDATSGRIYLPTEDLDRFGVDPASLRSPGPATSGQRALIAFEVYRARKILDDGADLVTSLRGWPRVAVAAFFAGGAAALDAVAAAGFDPLSTTPTARPATVMLWFTKTWALRRGSPR